MKKIELYNISGVGLIIPMKTGVTFTNQVAGIACLQPEMEGLFVPFNDCHLIEDYQKSLEFKLISMFAEKSWGNKLTEKEMNEIDTYLNSFPETRYAKVNKDLLTKSYEAWVWVTVKPPENSELSGLGIFKQY